MPRRIAFRSVLVGLAASCAPAASPPADSAAALPAKTTSDAQAGTAKAVATGEPKSDVGVQVALLDPALLAEIERRGFGLGELVSGNRAGTTRELARSPAFDSIFRVLRDDVLRVKREQPLAQVTSSLGFRLFDERWFDSPQMSFALTGVFNRLDRRPFYPASCGEVRFVYRLAYHTEQAEQPMSSRLPMTVNVVFWVDPDEGGCKNAASAWRLKDVPVFEKAGGVGLDVEKAAVELFASGPLSPAQRARLRLKSVETNLQTFRLQSTVQTSLGGHIEYGLRVFRPRDDDKTRFSPAPMENLPDVAALARDKGRRAELLAFLKQPDTLAAIDRGTLVVPDRFLATTATSFSPRGLSRTANRPFRKLFAPEDFADLALDQYTTIGSPAALLRRLDGASCTGCHQSRSIAGFHQVGFDPEDSPRTAALVSGMSAHLSAELDRRRAYVAALSDARTPDEFRPIPERQGVGHGEGAPCGLGDPGFRDWICDAGLTCQRFEDTEIGVCSAPTHIGSACEYGPVTSAAKPARDRVALEKHACSTGQKCWNNLSGIPLGACVAACADLDASGVCGDALDVDGYQECLRRKRPVRECQAEFVYRVGLRACDRTTPCRQDFVCARSGNPGTRSGVCIPPYFVFPLRLDGYPIPK
jgi:hypothetical protein